ncbi:MAG: tRNA lysidine(34) synthetase TilS [Lachnospiraceae bacterium]|nr:tRNA lysidine(34) synthetase TilS [Lachnospiraceae bacterium]
MIDKVRRYIEENRMIAPGDYILAGVSGGADSVCLFFLLQSLREKLSFGLSVMHVNHGLRETADRDEQFVRELCRKYQVPFTAKKVDVSSLADEKGLSLEEAARMARYEAFFEQAALLQKSGQAAVKLAVAHHRNDQAETVLFHLFRGSSLTGLRGMKPVRTQKEVTIIRPMLRIGRQEIEEYLKEQRLSYVTDETNADNRYARNRIRNEILPAASQFICPETVRHIAQTAEDLDRLEDYLDTIVSAEYESIVQRKYRTDKSSDSQKSTQKNSQTGSSEGNRNVIEKKNQTDRCFLLRIEEASFIGKHSYLQSELIYRAIGELAGRNKDITRRHVESVCGLFSMQVGRQIDLPYQICARRDYDAVELFVKQKQPHEKEKEGQEPFWQQLIIGGTIRLPDGSELSARVFPYEKSMEIPKNKYTKWLDYGKIRQCPVVRNRRVSDYFYIDDAHTKTVKDYMINEKIKKEEREQLFLICEDHHMLWMPGYRISAYYKISQKTENVLELVYLGGTKDGREDKRHDIRGGSGQTDSGNR